MPKKLERKLIAEAKRKHLIGKKKAAFVFGTLRNLGWKPRRKKK